MIVELTNLTDAPDKSPVQVELFKKLLNPGDSMKVYAALIDKKTRSLEAAGIISIGQIPAWYSAFKSKKARELTREELEAKLITPLPSPPKEVKEEAVEKKPLQEPAKKKG